MLEPFETATMIMKDAALVEPSASASILHRDGYPARVDALHVREKAHTRGGDALAAARRRPPMTEMAATTSSTGSSGSVTLLEAFEGRRMLIACSFLWRGRPDDLGHGRD